MISQLRQRARVYAWILLLPPLAACVSEPTRDRPEAAAAERQVSTPRAEPASVTAPAPPPAPTFAQTPSSPPPRPAASVPAAPPPPSTATAQAIESELRTRAAAAPESSARPETAISTAAAPTPAVRQDLPEPKVKKEPVRPASSPASRSAERDPRDAAARPGAEPAAKSPDTSSTARPDPEPPVAAVAADPEPSTNARTEVASLPSKPDAEASKMAEPDPGEETRLAMIPKEPVSALRTPEVGEPRYDEESLPLTFAGGWVLDRRLDALDGATRCLLFSRALTMFDGYEQTEVQLQVSLDAVLVKTASNIDLSYPDQGLRVDGGGLVTFEPQVVNERSLYTKQAVQLAMANGDRLTLSLGFWPTWPVTRTQNTTLSLAGFDTAFKALQACAQQH